MTPINVNFDGSSALPEFPKFVHSRLTDAENEVLNLIVSGHTRDQIGRIRGTSINTTRMHCQSLYRKLGVENRGELTSIAARSVLSEFVRSSGAFQGHASPLLPVRVNAPRW